jgi:hypothetical protein
MQVVPVWTDLNISFYLKIQGFVFTLFDEYIHYKQSSHRNLKMLED